MPAEPLGNLAIGLMELAEQTLESALRSDQQGGWQDEQAAGDGTQPARAGLEEDRQRAIEQGIWPQVEYLLWAKTRRGHEQALRGIRVAKATADASGDADEVDLLRRIEQGVRAASERHKNL
jgi:hypothetical protein